MKFQKSLATRSALALVAAGSAVALTACGAGQHTQTSNQAAAVNGTNATMDNITVRDASVVVANDGAAYLKFTASNVEEKGQKATLESVTVDGKEATLTGEAVAEPGCNLVASTPDEVAQLKKGAKNLCTTYTSPKLPSAEGVFPGGSLPAKFTFDAGTTELNLSVVAEHPTAGEAYRNPANEVVSPDEFHKEEHAEQGASH